MIKTFDGIKYRLPLYSNGSNWSMMMNDNQFLALSQKEAKESALNLLKRKAEDMKETGEKLLKKVQELQAMEPGQLSGFAKFTDHFNWAINDIENVIRNLNFAEFARAQAKLEILDQ